MRQIQTVAIVGVGLIGGSVCKAARARALAQRVVGIGRSAERLAAAQRGGVIDGFTTDLARGAAEADVVVVCTPVTQIAADIVRAAECGPPEMLVVDTGSTKRRIVEDVARHARARDVFVGAHPIAGSEQKGFEHARADLFDQRVCVLTPTSFTPPDRLSQAAAFWRALGCRIVQMDSAQHDRALALASHLPHAVAAALAASVPAEFLDLGGGAFRDGTRVAKSDPQLWTAIFSENRVPMLDALDVFDEQLSAFRNALQSGNPDALCRWWELARARRIAFDAVNHAEAGPDGATGDLTTAQTELRDLATCNDKPVQPVVKIAE